MVCRSSKSRGLFELLLGPVSGPQKLNHQAMLVGTASTGERLSGGSRSKRASTLRVSTAQDGVRIWFEIQVCVQG